MRRWSDNARYACCALVLFSLSYLAAWTSLPLTASAPLDPGGPLSMHFSLAAFPELVGHRIYVVNVSLMGTMHEVVLDTGSNDLWVDTTLGSSDASNSSRIVTDTGMHALLEYGVESVYTYAVGDVQYASVQVPSASRDEPLIVHNQPFVNVPGTTNITQYGNEGILGLGPPGGWSAIRDVLDGTEWDANPFLATMFAEYPKLQRFFTLSFGHRDDEGAIDSGVVTFGAIRPGSELSAIVDAHKIPLITGNFWDVPSRGFVIDGTLINLSDSDLGMEELRFVLDSGVYSTFAPPEYLRAIYSPVPGSFLLEDGTWSVPCNTMMNVSILLGETAYGIHPIDMMEVYEVVEEHGTWKPLCKGLFQSNSDPSIPFLIGLNVLRNLHVLHHYGEINGSSGPYVQIIGTSDTAAMAETYAAMNTARINAFLRSRNVSAEVAPGSFPDIESATSSPELSNESTISTLLQIPGMSVTEHRAARRWYVHAVVVWSASMAVLYSTFRRFRSRCREYETLRV